MRAGMDQVSGPPVSHQGTETRNWLVIAATASSGFVVLLAIWLPIRTVDTGHAGTQPRFSVVHVYGYMALLPASVPLTVSVLVGVLLSLSRARTAFLVLARVLSIALLALAALGTVTFLIGIFAVPPAVCLICASFLPHVQSRSTSGGRSRSGRS